jgi:hypothetical protein
VQRPPEACGAAEFFFLRYLVAITFPLEFDVWGRLCTHCEVAKVMTLHLSVNIFEEKKKINFLFFLKGKSLSKGRIVKERIQISHSTPGSRRRTVLKEAWKHRTVLKAAWKHH